VPGTTGSVTVDDASSMIAGTLRLASSAPMIARGSASRSLTSAADKARLYRRKSRTLPLRCLSAV
jgi:hypothetical protein